MATRENAAQKARRYLCEGRVTLQRVDHAFEALLFLAQLLRALGIVPDIGVFGELRDFGQPQLFGVEVKDTSAALRHGFRRRPAAWR